MKSGYSNLALDLLGSVPRTEVTAVEDRLRELAAYEALFLEDNMTFHKIARKIRMSRRFNPSSLCSTEITDQSLAKLSSLVAVDKRNNCRFTMRGEKAFPDKVLRVSPPIQLLYYMGDVGLLQQTSIAIVGSRKASDRGRRIARRIATGLANNGYTIVSGLANGIDVSAHQAAMDAGGRTIGVLGTPINYSITHGRSKVAQQMLADHLVISQVPILHYEQCNQKQRNQFFLQRNATISALSIGTVVVEADDVSGSLSTARQAINQEKKLFIPASCFENTRTKWPRAFQELGGFKVKSVNEILSHLEA